MNGLTLRISKGGGSKSKNSLRFSPVDVSRFIVDNNPQCTQFLNCKSMDEQLTVLKQILDQLKDEADDITVKFLSAVFFETEPKHPVKCFLIRHITKSPYLNEIFSKALSRQISYMVSDTQTSCKQYAVVVSKLACCMDNFPAGLAALRRQETLLVGYLDDCLRCCVDTLKNTQPLSPTEKNEIFNLVHIALRLLLQFFSHQNGDIEHPAMDSVKTSIQVLILDEDAPMDTKSVGGILYLTLFCLEKGPDAWVDILSSNSKNDKINLLLSNESCHLSLLSAISTVIPGAKVQSRIVEQEPALLLLNKKIMDISERSSADSVIILGVTRTLLQISKSLDKVREKSLGSALVENLLAFVWTHLDHYMDSVRHLAAQILGHVVKYCSKLDKTGAPEALNSLFTTISSHKQRLNKSYYVTLTCIVAEIGAAGVLHRIPHLINEVIDTLCVQALQASATTTLETLLESHAKQSDTAAICKHWVEPILERVSHAADSAVLNILENLLARAARLDGKVIEYILPRIEVSCLKSALTLVSVVRRSGLQDRGCVRGQWRGIISYHLLHKASVCVTDETRILALSLVVESPKSTEVFMEDELQFVLRFLEYNINTQSPNFRHLILSMMKKFIKRIDDSYKVLQRSHGINEYYSSFIEAMRSQLFDSLLEGANYSRRSIALQLLVWIEGISDESCRRIWKPYYVERLLIHLEDSYENNKTLALEILLKCPVDLLKQEYSISLNMEDVLKQASSVKPTDCVSAAYKLDIMCQKLPENVLHPNDVNRQPTDVQFVLLKSLHDWLCIEQEISAASIVNAAVCAPMYGVLHCMVYLVTKIDVQAISSEARWTSLIEDIIRTCIKVNSAVECVVNSSSPEGHLPMDRGGVSDHGNMGGIKLEDGRQVTAQMVLLCAWRSVKEVSLLLGELSSRLTICSENELGSLTPQQLLQIGQHFTKLLAETKHRGAFEQAYVGFTKLLARLWRCRTSNLHSLPRAWLAELMATISSGHKTGSLCATRRSAGLPFMIQALVTTELQVEGNPKCFHECMTTLLRLARTPPHSAGQTETAIETRTHSINILRALFRCSSLDESVAGYIGEGLVVALEGFEGNTWMERNSSTLLFSALMVRVFGVVRARGERLCARNKMTGRIFFLRYPMLYDFMLNKLTEVSGSGENEILRPSLFPILLLLARLYPSALEGTISNLKLVRFVPLVVSCANSAVLKTRQLAARAIVPLISPELYTQHIQRMLELISNKDIKRNYCHGILLQLIKLVEAKPEGLALEGAVEKVLAQNIHDTMWLIEHAKGFMPCWLLLDEYVKLINLIVMRFPSLIQEKSLKSISSCLHEIIFDQNKHFIVNSGRDICLANALYLHLIILEKYSLDTIPTVIQSLQHSSYEVVLSALNYVLILNMKTEENFDPEDSLQEYLSLISNKEHAKFLYDNAEYTKLLCNVIKTNKHSECMQKSLKALSFTKNNAKSIVKTKMNIQNLSDESVIKSLIDCIENGQETLTHIYLECLSKYVTEIVDCNANLMLELIRVLFACSSSDNNDLTRKVVVEFFYEHENVTEVLKNLSGLSVEKQFEYKATFYAILTLTVEDDDEDIRRKSMVVITRLHSDINKQTSTIDHKQTSIIDHKQTSEIDHKQTSTIDHEQTSTIDQKQTSEIDHKQTSTIDYKQTSEIDHKQTSTIDNKQTSTIDHKQTSEIDHKQTSTIDHEQTSTIDHEQTSTIDNKQTSTIDNKQTSEIDHKQTSTIDNKQTSEIDHKQTSTIDYKQTSEIDHKQTSTIDNKQTSEIDHKQTSEIDRVISSRAAEMLREVVSSEDMNIALLLVLALLDFRSEVCMNDDGNDECKVFDQNERYNIFLEETIWSRECAKKIRTICTKLQQNCIDCVLSCKNQDIFKSTYEKLCGDNVTLLQKFAKFDFKDPNSGSDPKIKLFCTQLIS